MYLSYCYVSVHDRVYHSFPTRRSSDLVSTIATERDRSAQGSWTWTWTRTRTWTRTCTWTRDVHVHVLVHVLVLVHVHVHEPCADRSRSVAIVDTRSEERRVGKE